MRRFVDSSTKAIGNMHFPKSRYCSSGVDVLAENKIAAWMRENAGNTPATPAKQGIPTSNHHRSMAKALGVGQDYIHSKILADNNFKPESVERRIELDSSWKKVQGDIQEVFLQWKNCENENNSPSSLVDNFSRSVMAKERFGRVMKELNLKAKRVNEAIISDSLRFNGRSPVPHARDYRLEQRIREALSNMER